MSQENVALVLRVLDQARHNPWHGPAGVREFFRRWVTPFDDWDYEFGHAIDAGDSVVVRVHQRGRGKGSGVAVDSEFWQVWTIRSGKVVWWRAYATEAEALQATGRRLRE